VVVADGAVCDPGVDTVLLLAASVVTDGVDIKREERGRGARVRVDFKRCLD
jgi:hypothetical protein